jgi:hypothetical protein
MARQAPRNTHVERHVRTVRHEWLALGILETIEEVQQIVTEWLWTCNNQHPNMAIGEVTRARKLNMATSVLRSHPAQTGRIAGRSLARRTRQGVQVRLKPGPPD